MKKFLMLTAAAFLMMGFAACTPETENTAASAEYFEIGIMQLTDHPALLAAQEGLTAHRESATIRLK